MKQRNLTESVQESLASMSASTLNTIRILAIIFGIVFFTGGWAAFPFNIVFGIGCFWLLGQVKTAMYGESRRHHNDNVIDAQFTVHQPKPDIPRPKPVEHNRLHPVYTQTMNRLEASEKELNRLADKLSEYLDTFFADSTISKDRFMSQIRSARKVCSQNTEKARNAIDLFGDSNRPSPTRQEVLDQYVTSSEVLVKQVNDIIDALLKTDLTNTQKANATLDESMIQLRELTQKYENVY